MRNLIRHCVATVALLSSNLAKVRTVGRIPTTTSLVLLAAACLSPTAAQAQINLITKTVNCDAPLTGNYPTIQKALNSLDLNGPIEIIVTGTCKPFHIGDGDFARNSVYIHPPNGQRATITSPTQAGTVVSIADAHGIVIERLDISGGGNGVLVFDASKVNFYDVTIENNAGNGVEVEGHSTVFFTASRIRNNGVFGVNVSSQGGTMADFEGDPTQGGPHQNVIEGNGQFGINAGSLGIASLNGANLIRNNGGNTSAITHGGIHASRTSAVLMHASRIGGGVTEIADNVSFGILAEVNSSVTLQGALIHDNTDGVRVQTRSVLELVGQNTFASNANADVSCDVWSLLTGDLSGIDRKSIDCKKVDGAPKNKNVDVGPKK
jgi:hypothetical protein